MKATKSTRSNLTDRVYKGLTALLSSSAFLFLFLILGSLLLFAYPSIIYNGLTFFTSTTWNPATGANNIVVIVDGIKVMDGATYGMLVFFVGTLISSAIALLLGVPVSLGIATFLSQVAPRRVASVGSFLVELLAGIPSIIYGLWAFIVLGPWLRYTLEPAIAGSFLKYIPGFGGPVYSSGLLNSGLILSVMIVPIVASISRDSMASTPVELKEGGKALGMTNWEVTRKIVFPFARSGIVGSAMLGLGRALGETMAVAMVCEGATSLPLGFYSPLNSMAAFIALNLDDSFLDPTKMWVYALAEIALVLLATTMVVNVTARLIVRRASIKSEDRVVVGL